MVYINIANVKLKITFYFNTLNFKNVFYWP